MEESVGSNEPAAPNGLFNSFPGPGKLRRNGKPMSCEPCRISKIRCDHSLPCKKCQNRRIENKCLYKHDPMAKTNGVTKSNGRNQIARALSRPFNARRTKDTSSSSSSSRSARGMIGRAGCPLAPQQLGFALRMAPPLCEPVLDVSDHSKSNDEPRSGYLGFTSFASTFPSSGASLVDTSMDQFNPLSGSSNEDYPIAWRTGKEEMLMKTLQRWNVIEKLVEAHYTLSTFIFIPVPFLLKPLALLREQLQEVFASQNPMAMTKFAERVTSNTCKPLKIAADTPVRDFHLLYSGENLRWEFIGTIICTAGLGAMFLEEDHTKRIFEGEDDPDPANFFKLMCVSSSACRELCCEISPLNDILVWFLAQDVVLQSNCVGDTSHLLWRRFGDLTSDLMALGFHRETAIGANIPFYLAETRKRIWGKYYRSDKSISTFLGRPPRISRHYCDYICPLDLDDATLLLEGDELAAKMAELDDHGWNIREIEGGKVRPAAIIRLRYQSSLLREEILELSLGGEQTEGIAEKLNAIISRCSAGWEAFPRWLRYDTTSKLDSLKPDGHTVLMLSYLEHLQSLFQIHRLLCRLSQTNLPALFEISVQSLTTVIDIMRTPALSAEVRNNLPWLLMFYGLPAAGIIATELRCCTLQNKPIPPQIPRAEVLRTLSLLIPWFDWIVAPESCAYSHNYKSCAGIVRMLSRTLDEILNHHPVAAAAPVQASSASTEVASAPLESTISRDRGPPTPRTDTRTVHGFPQSQTTQDNDLVPPSSESTLRPGFESSSSRSHTAIGPGSDSFGTAATSAEALGDDTLQDISFEGMPMESEGFLTWLDDLDWENTMGMPLPEIYPSSSASKQFRDGLPE